MHTMIKLTVPALFVLNYLALMPVYAREVYGSALDLGFMYAALGGGSIIGATLFAVFGHRLPRRATILTGFTVRALSFWVPFMRRHRTGFNL